MPDGSRLAAPRLLARTTIITRTVVAVPEGFSLKEAQEPALIPEGDSDRNALSTEQQQFWTEFLTHLKLDDPEQPVPKPARLGFIAFSLPAPSGSSWLTVYRDLHRGEVGVFLSSSRNTAGEYAMQVIAESWSEIKEQLGGTAQSLINREGRPRIVDSLTVSSLAQPDPRLKAFLWLADRINTFVNVMRPRVRSAVADYLPTSN